MSNENLGGVKVLIKTYISCDCINSFTSFPKDVNYGEHILKPSFLYNYRPNLHLVLGITGKDIKQAKRIQGKTSFFSESHFIYLSKYYVNGNLSGKLEPKDYFYLQYVIQSYIKASQKLQVQISDELKKAYEKHVDSSKVEYFKIDPRFERDVNLYSEEFVKFFKAINPSQKYEDEIFIDIYRKNKNESLLTAEYKYDSKNKIWNNVSVCNLSNSRKINHEDDRVYFALPMNEDIYLLLSHFKQSAFYLETIRNSLDKEKNVMHFPPLNKVIDAWREINKTKKVKYEQRSLIQNTEYSTSLDDKFLILYVPDELGIATGLYNEAYAKYTELVSRTQSDAPEQQLRFLIESKCLENSDKKFFDKEPPKSDHDNWQFIKDEGKKEMMDICCENYLLNFNVNRLSNLLTGMQFSMTLYGLYFSSIYIKWQNELFNILIARLYMFTSHFEISSSDFDRLWKQSATSYEDMMSKLNKELKSLNRGLKIEDIWDLNKLQNLKQLSTKTLFKELGCRNFFVELLAPLKDLKNFNDFDKFTEGVSYLNNNFIDFSFKLITCVSKYAVKYFNSSEIAIDKALMTITFNIAGINEKFKKLAIREKYLDCAVDYEKKAIKLKELTKEESLERLSEKLSIFDDIGESIGLTLAVFSLYVDLTDIIDSAKREKLSSWDFNEKVISFANNSLTIVSFMSEYYCSFYQFKDLAKKTLYQNTAKSIKKLSGLFFIVEAIFDIHQTVEYFKSGDTRASIYQGLGTLFSVGLGVLSMISLTIPILGLFTVFFALGVIACNVLSSYYSTNDIEKWLKIGILGIEYDGLQQNNKTWQYIYKKYLKTDLIDLDVYKINFTNAYDVLRVWRNDDNKILQSKCDVKPEKCMKLNAYTQCNLQILTYKRIFYDKKIKIQCTIAKIKEYNTINKREREIMLTASFDSNLDFIGNPILTISIDVILAKESIAKLMKTYDLIDDKSSIKYIHDKETCKIESFHKHYLKSKMDEGKKYTYIIKMLIGSKASSLLSIPYFSFTLKDYL